MLHSKALLLAYVRYIDKGDFAEVMLFCRPLESTTTTTDIYIYIYTNLESHFDAKNI